MVADGFAEIIRHHNGVVLQGASAGTVAHRTAGTICAPVPSRRFVQLGPGHYRNQGHRWVDETTHRVGAALDDRPGGRVIVGEVAVTANNPALTTFRPR